MLEFDIVSVVLSIVVTLGVASVLVLPFFSSEAAGGVATDDVDDSASIELQTRKERLLSSLVELEEEFAAGKIDSATYEASKERITIEAAQCVEALEQR